MPALIHLPEVDSTNAEVMRRALAGNPLPLWVRADRQTRGRGRSGRPWQSQFTGNLYASLGLTLSCGPETAAQLSLVTGVAVIDALRSFEPSLSRNLGGDSGPAPDRLELKWPNDILIGPAKVGGILIESTRIHQQLLAVVGIGINLVAAPEDTGRDVSSLNLHKIEANPRDMLSALQQHLDHWLGIWQEGAGFATCRIAWAVRATAVGTELSVNAGGGPVFGTFQGVDEDGALLLETRYGRQRFSFGDVTLGVA
jgi:BirA family transcriptional regulator, biotin operon repressor / biotin---[acetyl-CoA-carboxylase] ligase